MEYEQQYDDRNCRTLSLATPEHRHRPTDGQHNDQWTEHHKDD